MYNEYPIERLARSTSTRFQMGFARMTMHLLPEFNEVALEPSETGLKILAAHELALDLPAEVIRQIHADQVEFGAPEVRLVYRDGLQEPIMWVRAGVGHTYVETVIQDLVRRDAEIEEVDWLATPTVIRAKAPLRQLLGYAKALAVLSDGSAELQMWLSHYAPMPPEPGKAA
jgi:predicted membrane GTPase involved in stress response